MPRISRNYHQVEATSSNKQLQKVLLDRWYCNKVRSYFNGHEDRKVRLFGIKVDYKLLY
jgi:hypothetical protein